jgi:hypothetical protein
LPRARPQPRCADAIKIYVSIGPGLELHQGLWGTGSSRQPGYQTHGCCMPRLGLARACGGNQSRPKHFQESSLLEKKGYPITEEHMSRKASGPTFIFR